MQGTGFEIAMTVDFGSETPTPTNLASTSFDVTLGSRPTRLATVIVTQLPLAGVWASS